MRKILAWLNKRFPETLVVTLYDYNQLRQEVGQLNVAIQAIGELHNRLQAVEKQITNLNNANGFISTAKGSFRLER